MVKIWSRRLGRRFWWALGLSLAGLGLPGRAWGAEAAAEAMFKFQLRGQSRLVADQTPRCLRRVAESGTWEPVAIEAKFSPGGLCTALLPAGTYRFEVLAANAKEARLVAIRSGAVEIGPGAAAGLVLPEAVKLPLHVSLDGIPVRLLQLAIRSIGPTGEARWKRAEGDFGAGPALYLSPDPVLQVAIVGETDRVSVALWKRFQPTRAGELQLRAADYSVCEFAFEPATPRLSSGTGRMLFPDGEMAFPLRAGYQLITNRERVAFGYELAEAARRKIVVAPSVVHLTKTTRLPLGGLLRPRPWAIAGWKDDGKFYPKWEGALADAAGREVDLGASSIDHRAVVRARDGTKAPEGSLSDPWIKAFKHPAEMLDCEMSWSWGGPQQFHGPPEPWTELKSEHFTLQAPSLLKGKAENYLAQLERSFAGWRQVSGRKGPRLVSVGWRMNTHNAKAQVGGGTPWMSMPFRGLHEAETDHRYPWFMIHEMGHTFGYNHGANMDAAVGTVERLNDRERWKEVDAAVD